MKENGGFVLIEVLLAIAIVSLIILPVGSLFIKSSITNKKSQEIIIGTTLAQEKLEELKAYPIERLKDINDYQETIALNGLLFQRKSNIRPESLDLYIITVEVIWDGGDVKLVTYRGSY